MMTFRPLRWPEDVPRLAGLDTSFTTDRIYRLARHEWGFTLVDERIDPPFHKEYGAVAEIEPGLREMEYTAVAEDGEGIAGLAAAKYEPWNRRLVVWHLYVASARRREGIGRALIDQLALFARSAGARCLWLETQNVNYPAIQFYRNAGFRLCGLDESLYDPAGPGGDEVGLFFTLELKR